MWNMSTKQLKISWEKRTESPSAFAKETKLSVPASLQKRKEVRKGTELT
jgi:hypothetical protein